jgi:hypothetical protein
MVLVVLFSLLWQSCSQKQLPEVKDADYGIDMAFPKEWYSKNGDTLFVYFKVTNLINGKKIKFEDLDNAASIDSLLCTEIGNDVQQIVEKCGIAKISASENQQDLVSKNSAFLFLIDRTNVHELDLQNIKNAIAQSLQKLPDSTAYISFIDKYAERKLITSENFDAVTQNDFTIQKTGKIIQKAILEQFKYLITESKNTNKDCYLLICTDGKLFQDDNDINNAITEIKQEDAAANNVVIHSFRYGKGDDEKNNRFFEGLSTFRQQNNGRFYSITDAAVLADTIASFINTDLSFDYKLTYVRNYNNDYVGQPLSLSVCIKTKSGKTLFGKINEYSIGTPLNPIRMSPINFFISLFLSLLTLFLIYFHIQVVFPYIKSKRENFKKKYVIKYKPSEKVVMEMCTWCGEPLEEDDEVVVKCQHKSHYECWQERGHHCIEYGRYCKDGIEHHFDRKHAFDLKTGPFYRKWAIAGAVGGLIISIVDYMSLKHVLPLFNGMSEFMVNTFFPNSQRLEVTSREGVQQLLVPDSIVSSFSGKMTGFLIAGILLGFTLTFMFSWINEFRSKKGRVLLSLFFRSVLGAITGFIAFLVGSILCILFGKTGTGIAPYIDWIPWLLFGLGVALCLSVKTTIKRRDAIIGGLISGFVSFACLFSSYIFSPFGMFFSFMLCSAGIGIAIVAQHYAAQKYFVKVIHPNKECEIAIHKWMNESGGRNEVTIGKSVNSIIQINWANEEEKERIAEIQAKLYIDKKQHKPCITALQEGMQFEGRDAKVNVPNLLEQGKSFTIGNTKFEYIEK